MYTAVNFGFYSETKIFYSISVLATKIALNALIAVVMMILMILWINDPSAVNVKQQRFREEKLSQATRRLNFKIL